MPIAAPGGSDLRPDHAPPRVATEGARLRLRVYAALLAAIAAWFAWQRFGLPLLSARHRPFARAAREVARLQRAGDFRQAVLTLHRAFDQSAGAAMFGASAGGFVAGRPAFAPIAGDVQRFFALSQREFFAGGAGRDFAWLAAFAAACRDAELRG